MNWKRPLELTSPDHSLKKSSSSVTMAPAGSQTSSASSDTFSWERLVHLFDDKLKDVARKTDLMILQNDVKQLRSENEFLKQEIRSLTSRLESVDQRSRRSNVVLAGLQSSNPNDAKSEFAEICASTLKSPVDVLEVRKLPSRNSYTVTLANIAQATNILSAKRNLRGTSIFLQKDYTKNEQSTRYNLRQLRKMILTVDKRAKVKVGEFCIFFNDCKFKWSDGKIVASSPKEAELLRRIMIKGDYNFEITVKSHIDMTNNQNPMNSTALATTSALQI